MSEFDEALKTNEALRSNLSKVQEDLNPVRVLGLLERISSEDCELLDIHDRCVLACGPSVFPSVSPPPPARPENLIVTHLAVPPVCIRPSVEMDSAGSNEDDLTMKLMQIVEVNNVLRQGVEKGLPINQLMETWDYLQLQCALYINSEIPGVPQAFQNSGKPLRGFVQRLKGKQGRFRGNLSGPPRLRAPRTRHPLTRPAPQASESTSAAAPSSPPTPTCGWTRSGCPRMWHGYSPSRSGCARASQPPPLSPPARLNRPRRHNIEKLRKRVKNGMNVHPGANFVLFKSGGKQYLKYGDRKRVSHELKYGDVVERHLEVRQPRAACSPAAAHPPPP